ncbi:MAG TPA: small ribosomal subunit Rsm22 family protein [Verrucomicrobiae bacterium]|nr:small ribosomal subunit Rsm22 family protein [Verrucomicrobiae bacterium]
MAAPLTWETLDWAALDRLRETFLAGRPTGAAYWQSMGDLANYDFTYAQRIGWKWDAVLRELQCRGWLPPAAPLLDWGCGSGVASRCVLDALGAESFESLRLFDQSPLAMDFAAQTSRRRFPSLRIEPVESAWLARAEQIGVLVISHVLNELDEAGGRALRQVIDRAQAVLWVEPGTFADSRALIAVHESLREHFLVVAPCTHQAACGLLAPENGRHWCHRFAAPPSGIMADANWVRFAQRAGIDLRSIPYSFLVLERRGLRGPVPGLLPGGWSRVIGAPRVYKGFAKVLSCQEAGVRELELQKRDVPAVFKAFKDREAEAVYRFGIDGDRVTSAKSLDTP